jgi:hypothetical protein
VFYVRVARLFEELKIAHGDGSFTRRLAQLAKIDVLILDLCAAHGYVKFAGARASARGCVRTPVNITLPWE